MCSSSREISEKTKRKNRDKIPNPTETKKGVLFLTSYRALCWYLLDFVRIKRLPDCSKLANGEVLMEERQARSCHRLLHRLHNSETSSASRGNRARWNRAPCTIASSSAIFLASSFPFPRSRGVDALSERPFFWRAHYMGTCSPPRINISNEYFIKSFIDN